jgi:hypothetical protein
MNIIIKRVNLILFFLSLVTSCFSSAMVINNNAPKTYTVQRGDTLWAIAERYTDSPWSWVDLWHNSPYIQNPHLIYPGDIVGIVYVNKQKKLSLLSRSKQTQNIPVGLIDVSMLSPFLTETKIKDLSGINRMAYVLSGEEDRLMMASGDKVYVNGHLSKSINDMYGIYRMSKAHYDPITHEFLGQELILSGMAKKIKNISGLSLLSLKMTNSPVMQGNKVDLVQKLEVLNAMPHYVKKPISARIISILGDRHYAGVYDVLIINKGARDELKEGGILGVNKIARTVVDPKTHKDMNLPPRSIGLVMLIQVYEKLSYALIVKGPMAISIGDIVSSVRK